MLFRSIYGVKKLRKKELLSYGHIAQPILNTNKSLTIAVYTEFFIMIVHLWVKRYTILYCSVVLIFVIQKHFILTVLCLNGETRAKSKLHKKKTGPLRQQRTGPHRSHSRRMMQPQSKTHCITFGQPAQENRCFLRLSFLHPFFRCDVATACTYRRRIPWEK